MSGASALRLAANWPIGPTANSTTSVFPTAMRSTKPQNHSGGHEGSQAGVASSGGCRPYFRKLWERAMTTMRFDDLRQYSDALRARSGETVTVRFVEPR